MLERDAMPSMVDAVEAVKDYLRLDCADEDAFLDGLLATAIVQAEAWIGTTLIERTMRELIGASAAWTWLKATPVRAILGVRSLALDGVEAPVVASAYALDIDADGRGRIRFLTLPTTARAVVSYRAGIASSWFALPETVRQGVIRLVAHHYVNRERSDAEAVPGNVTALWMSERQVRL